MSLSVGCFQLGGGGELKCYIFHAFFKVLFRMVTGVGEGRNLTHNDSADSLHFYYDHLKLKRRRGGPAVKLAPPP